MTEFDDKTSKNYKFLYESLNGQVWGRDENNLPYLEHGVVGCVLEGSSRSTKTWGGIYFSFYLALIKHKDKGCTINIYRETYNEFKTTLYDDFKRALNLFGLDNKFDRNDEIKSFKIGKTKISFLGDGKHGGTCDYAFFNEAMMIDQSVFDQVEMRCREFWWMDYNPSFTDHWVFDSVVARDDVGFLRTTFRDNKFISATELNKILGFEPWEGGTYEVTKEGDLLYLGEPITDKHEPPPHIRNVDQGTADPFMWKCYGLGLRGAMDGVILDGIYGMDFGFVKDPLAFGRYAQEGMNIYLELLAYHPIETPEEVDALLNALGIDKHSVIIADSSDQYKSEKHGAIKMVDDLYNDYDWFGIDKVSKTKNLLFWLLDMKRYKIHIVKNKLYKHAKKERENYIWKEINGQSLNTPIDDYNHFWDQARYAHMKYSEGELTVQTN